MQAASYIADALTAKRAVANLSLSPPWRNWQTRWTQNPVPAMVCGFDSLRRYQFILKAFGLQLLWAQIEMLGRICRELPDDFAMIGRDVHLVGQVDSRHVGLFELGKILRGNVPVERVQDILRVLLDHCLVFRAGHVALF